MGEVTTINQYINAPIKKQNRRFILIAALAIISISVLFIVFVPNRERIRATRLLQGSWIEYSDSEFATTIDFVDFGELDPIMRFLERRNLRRFDGSFEMNVSYRLSEGAFRIYNANQLVLYFSGAPPGRDRPYAIETLEFHVTEDILILSGSEGTVKFVRNLR